MYVENLLNASRFLYSCPNVSTRYRLAPLQVSTPTFMRAPGGASGLFALECALDELAWELDMDPVELRLRNEPERNEHDGLPFSSRSLRACLETAAHRFGWKRRAPKPAAMRDLQGRLLGYGCAAATYPVYRYPATVCVRLRPDGTALVATAASDMGPGTYTSMTQVAADALGLPIERVRFELGDTLMPEAPVHGGSVTMASVGPAVQAACALARRKTLERAGLPNNHADLGSVLQRLGEGIEVTAGSEPGEETTRYSMHAFGAVFAEVAVDPDLGLVRVPRLVGAYAAGRIVNPKLARSQITGAMVMGLGMALLEHTAVDPRTGRVVNSTLADYLMPVNADIHQLDAHFVEEQDEHVNALGVKGIAELPTVGVAAAIANAVYHATGKRVRELPITLEKLL
jgi:xanthine dehydrogenase YagR molybdenum-binding subunit